MALYDTLVAARDAIEQWLADNPKNPNADAATKAKRQKMVDAEDELSQALETIEDEELQDSVNNLQTDAQALRDAADRISKIEGTFAEVNAVVADVGTVVGILEKLVPA